MFASNVNVRIEKPWHTRAVYVWFYWRVNNGVQIWNAFTGETKEVPDGMVLDYPPSLTLPDESFLKAFVETAAEVMPPNTQMFEHLKDAIKVRDRLLTIIEKRADKGCEDV